MTRSSECRRCSTSCSSFSTNSADVSGSCFRDPCELHRRLGTHWPEAALFHYRTRSGAEVDFVLEVGRELWGIEVKAGQRVTRSMLRGLASFASRSARVKRRIVVFLGERPQLVDGVEILPLADFLAELPV